MRVAIVHDWLTGMRGGERVLEALLELYPEADLYSLVAFSDRLSPALAWLIRVGTPLAGILMSAGFFFSLLAPGAAEPSRAIGLIYAGAVILAVSVLSLGIGLLRAK